ncbi:MAG: Jag N-terminal domain-containing protein [Bacilli bacterium]|nr:Jag N-terminal domain-containing protein [Bacilli bacterium]MDD4077313.1 Jag N-terminal domain-containing protein [Bacilli bacterium]MDD4387818.1 Jag N-terminal domain-containing protein [Bacilli bacterium]
MERKLYQVKTLEEAKALAVEDFGLNETELTFTVVNEKKGFLGFGRRIEVEVVVSVDGIEKGKEYLQKILDNNCVRGFIEKKVRGNHVSFNIEAGDFNGYLIGKNARNLVSLQLLVAIIINNYYSTDNMKTVMVDVGGYKKRREHNLERMAIQYGKQVARTKQKIQLNHLNAYERKIIHNKLANWKDVKTYSIGDEPYRNLVIEPKK